MRRSTIDLDGTFINYFLDPTNPAGGLLFTLQLQYNHGGTVVKYLALLCSNKESERLLIMQADIIRTVKYVCKCFVFPVTQLILPVDIQIETEVLEITELIVHV
mgnify:CR=1 FL=1